MENTSEQYKIQSRRSLRNESYLRVTFGIIDPDALPSSTITSDTEEYYSLALDIGDVSKSAITDIYETLEHNHYLLDGEAEAPPASDWMYQGYVSSLISDEEGVFETPPSMEIDFSDYFVFSGLTFKFDGVNGDHAKQIRVKAFLDDVEVFNELGEIEYFEGIFEEDIPVHNRLLIQFVSTNKPFRRIRLTHILFGLVKIFDDSTITETTDKRVIEPMNTKLPKYEFSFTIIDAEKAYNPDNPTGVYKYLESQQPVRYEYGYKLDDDSIEWVLGGNNFTTGEVDVTSSGALSKVTFKSSSTLEYLTDVYDQGVYSATPKTLKQLAEEVLQFAELPLNELSEEMWILDDSLSTYSTSSPLPLLPIRECLQLIANAGMCTLSVNREGKIVIAPFSWTPQDFRLDFKDFMNPPEVKKYPSLYSVRTSYTTINLGASEQLSSVPVSVALPTVMYFEYEPAAEVVLNVGAGLTLTGSVQYYARGCYATLHGTGTITITGKRLTFRRNPVTVQYLPYGDECPIENELISTRQHAVDYAAWVKTFVELINEYTVNTRGYPEVDIGDVIDIETLFEETLPVIVTESDVTYNGALRGRAKFLIGRGLDG